MLQLSLFPEPIELDDKIKYLIDSNINLRQLKESRNYRSLNMYGLLDAALTETNLRSVIPKENLLLTIIPGSFKLDKEESRKFFLRLKKQGSVITWKKIDNYSYYCLKCHDTTRNCIVNNAKDFGYICNKLSDIDRNLAAYKTAFKELYLLTQDECLGLGLFEQENVFNPFKKLNYSQIQLNYQNNSNKNIKIKLNYDESKFFYKKIRYS